MPDPHASARVPFIGLTGGMGAGKSTALEAFSELGAATLSTDAVVHEVLEMPTVRDEIVARFGKEVLASEGGEIDRERLADRVFSRAEDRGWLEELIWPIVGEHVAAWRAALEAESPACPVGVVEAPLLFEAGMEDVFDATIAVIADEELRSERASGRGHVGTMERSNRQLSQEEKAGRATHTVRNDGTREELKLELSRLLATMGR